MEWGGEVYPGGMWIGRGAGWRSACGGHCCVIRHTFCRPGGTFQLSVATDAAAEGRRGVVDPERRAGFSRAWLGKVPVRSCG